MENLKRLKLKKWESERVNTAIDRVVEEILALVAPEEIILFGSAVRGEFDDHSDLDLVVIFKDVSTAIEGQRAISRNRSAAEMPVDILCVDRASFEKKSEIGGVYAIAKAEGRVVYREKE